MEYWLSCGDLVHFVSAGVPTEAVIWEEVPLGFVESWLPLSLWGIFTEYSHPGGFLVLLVMSLMGC